jgi:hypothetical protein
MNGRGLRPVTALLSLALATTIGSSTSPAQMLPPGTVTGPIGVW